MKNFAITLLSLILLNVSVLAQEHPTFVAKNGDTIYSILRKNKLSPSKYVAEFKELNKGKLSKNGGLLIGVKYKIPIIDSAPIDSKVKTKTIIDSDTTSHSSTKHQTVVAKNGDGISIILNRYGLSSDKYTAEFIELNKSNIGKNNSLYIGKTYKLPLDAKVLEEDTDQHLPKKLTTQHTTEHQTVVAKNGDAISIILSRNGLAPSKYTQAFIALNKDNIGSNHEIYAGRTYKLPLRGGEQAASSDSDEKASPNKVVKKLSNPLYGSAYQHFNQISTKLNGAIYYLISGHAGPDPGAHGYYNGKTIYEDEYAYDVTLRLSRELESHGAKVYMIVRDRNDGIRDDVYLKADKDERCYPNQSIPLNQVRRLNQRSEAVNKLYKKNKGSYQRCIITHIDSRGKHTPIDAFFYYDERSSGGKKLAHNLYNTLNSKYRNRANPRAYHGTVSTRSLYVLRNTLPIAAFIELGNINYYRDIQRIVLKDNRQALANWLCEGLIIDYRQNKSNK